MTDKEKLLKLRKSADAMYYAAQHLTTDASRLHKAMDEYHQFIINEYHKKEPTIPDIVDEHFYEMLKEEPARKVWHDMDEVPQKKADIVYYRPDRNKIESRKGGMGSYTKCYTKWAYTNDLVGIEEIPLRLPMIPQENATESLGISREEYKKIVDECIYSKEEPVSEDLEEACEQLAENARKHKAETISPFFSPTDYKQGVIDGANWKEQQMMKDAVNGWVFRDIKDGKLRISDNKECWNGIRIPEKSIEKSYLICTTDDAIKVKLVIVKED